MSSGKLHLFILISLLLYDQGDVDTARYVFEVEWFDTEASIIRKFYLFYFLSDDTIELFDIKKHRIFLKRTKCEGITLGHLYVGGTVKILSRQLKIIDFGDIYTKNKLGIKSQKTFAMIKPDTVDKSGEIMQIIYKEGFKISKLKMANMTKENAVHFYKEHEGKPFLPFLVNYMTSGPVIAMELIGENAVTKWREIIGPTDSEVARQEAPNSIRALFGKDKTYNAVHGSDSADSAERELSIFFPTSQSLDGNAPKAVATFKNCTCCVIKPHAVQEGLLGDIVYEIQRNNFKISGMQMFYMDYPSSKEFLEVYKGVVSEYSDMVGQLVSGPSVAFEIVTDSEDTPTKFRQFVGPIEPEIAKVVRPNTLRAKFGKTKVLNAVHCTDLPEDGLLEVEYFFRILQ